MKYIFLDNSNYPPSKVLYTCEMEDILEATAIFEKDTGIKFSKKYISVQLIKGS